jgi:HEAT repeat protein
VTDEERQLLRDLEDEFVVGCRYWYVLQLWQQCGSFEASSIQDRIRVAYDVLAKAGAGGTQWVWTGWLELVDHLIERLDDAVAEVRQQAAIALGDLEAEGERAVPVLLQRLKSSAITFHDRACSAWALGQIKHGSDQVVPALVAVLRESADLEAAGELRRYSAEAIERLTDDPEVLLPVARASLQDRFWKCRMIGLGLVEQLGEGGRELLPFVQLLVNDETAEIRGRAERIVIGFE